MAPGFYVALTFLAIFAPMAIAGIVDAVLKHRRKMAEIEGGGKIARLTEENAELTDKVELLEDRLAVLERIATDPARRTADEIERLR